MKQKQILCFIPWLLLSLLTLPFLEARFVVEKNSLSVTSPESIKGTHDSAIRNFRIPQYGGSMAGTVVYPKQNQKSCKEFSDLSISFKSQPGALPTFLLVNRGGMVTKETQGAGKTCEKILTDLSKNCFGPDCQKACRQRFRGEGSCALIEDLVCLCTYKCPM